MDIEELRELIANEPNPVLVATELGFFLSDSLEDGSINFYEGFWVADLCVSLLREGYSKAAWSYTVGYQHILSLVMLYVMARYFGEQSQLEKYRSWALEAESHLAESREHYSLSLLERLRNCDNSGILAELAAVREGNKPFKHGPYHSEVFPFDYVAPEKELMAGVVSSTKEIRPEIVSLLADIGVVHG
ncbi:hypothetical protein [Ectopseudomonas alcaliphila]|uniref:Uncharacterized protein n=1 Tax=Ectopseudomonas alcaliphila TaxID=101564 RepID=A0ABU4Q2Z0_9GAMM|nr:hypothetical protein [Pseudomonas alcaliphila]MDX5993941.1 hypothetical protein [Pseudomonas alcaliphila]